MTQLDFIGKEYIRTHHYKIPHRVLTYDKKRSLGDVNDENLIIHGDNMEALKALLPRYGGRVKCIYIDPPYNTGKGDWVYNDNVDNKVMQRWFKQHSPVDENDLDHHEKWLCMMWPRLQLLRELLSDDGSIFVSIDDNEQHHLRIMMDEIFGEENFVTNIVWQKKYSPQNDATHFSDNHDFVLVYAKDKNIWQPTLLPRTEKQDRAYKNPDNDPRGLWKVSGFDVKTYSEEYDYPITTPSGRVVYPPRGRCWACGKEKFEKMVKNNEIWFGKNGNSKPSTKRFLSEVRKGLTPLTVWLYKDIEGTTNHESSGDEKESLCIPRWMYKNVGHTESATKALKQIEVSFNNPKPHTLIERILHIGSYTDSIILDSFAGSGTTAHAVLALNKQDGGNRKFILIECEDYADNVTAERVRKVIRGILASKDFKEPLGGSFAYYTLGNKIGMEELLTGRDMPSYSDLAAYLLYTATGIKTTKKLEKGKNGLFYSAKNVDYYLLYEPTLKYMRSNDAVLNEKMADCISAKGKSAVVFAADKYISQRDLTNKRIDFSRIPYEIHGGA